MSKFNHKGYTSIPVIITETGKLTWVAVKIGSQLHKKHMRSIRQFNKTRREQHA